MLRRAYSQTVLLRQRVWQLRVISCRAVERMLLLMAFRYRLAQRPLHRVDRVFRHQPVRGPLSTENADESALLVHFDFVIANQLFRRVFVVTRRDQRPQSGESAYGMFRTQW